MSSDEKHYDVRVGLNEIKGGTAWVVFETEGWDGEEVGTKSKVSAVRLKPVVQSILGAKPVPRSLIAFVKQLATEKRIVATLLETFLANWSAFSVPTSSDSPTTSSEESHADGTPYSHFNSSSDSECDDKSDPDSQVMEPKQGGREQRKIERVMEPDPHSLSSSDEPFIAKVAEEEGAKASFADSGEGAQMVEKKDEVRAELALPAEEMEHESKGQNSEVTIQRFSFPQDFPRKFSA